MLLQTTLLSSKDFEKKKEGEKDDTKNSGNGAQDTPDMFGQNTPATNSFANSPNNKQNKEESKTKETELYKTKIPWTLNLAYSVNYSNNGLTSSVGSNTLMFSGDVELSPKWKVGFSSGYDVKDNAFTYTRLSFARDLDSWRLNFNWTPFGINSSYNFLYRSKIISIK